MTLSQDLNRPFVIPIMDDVLHHVGISSFWDRLEELTSDHLTTVGHALFLEQRLEAG